MARGRRLGELDVAALGALVRGEGAVLLRGFQPRAEEYATLMRRLLRRHKHTPVHRGTHPLHRLLQTTTPGTQAMSYHAEYAHLPDRVDVISFWCQVPGGETRVCDGARLMDAVSPTTRELLTAQRIRYLAWHDPAAWTAACGTHDVTEVQKQAEGMAGYQVHPGPGGGLITEFTTGAITGPTPALVANLLPGAYAALTVVLEDGRPVPGDVVEDVRSSAGRCGVGMVWEPGDVVLLDNWRMLHGRGEQTTSRKAWAVLGYW
ncbi:MAG: TauD/TfdA family dioxygenase [Myxococcota bacterium]